MSDARPLPSQTTTGTGGVSRRYSKTIEITLGPPSTMSATTGTPWPIPALKKEKKRKKKKREKNTKPANQRNKKGKQKAQTKITEHGGDNNIWRDKIRSKNCTENPFAESPHHRVYLTLPSPRTELPGCWGWWRHPPPYFPGAGGVCAQGEEGEEGRLVDEVLSQQPEDWKLNVTLSKSPLYPVV